MSIRLVCDPNVVTVERKATVQEASRMMRKKHVGSLVVVDDEEEPRPLGIVIAMPDDSVLKTIRVMHERGVRRMLVGILSANDVFQVLSMEMAALAGLSLREQKREKRMQTPRRPAPTA